jgi:hypothetical protein
MFLEHSKYNDVFKRIASVKDAILILQEMGNFLVTYKKLNVNVA